ncbi:hypothetical protein FHS92_001484 [Sphingobium subterraneum]|uniref:Uncharacterized protein n=1 Tax=Sphingobium subterraneum TaxID=627688 RepID=A0A841J5C0_9SPHN|nr:hypothetical protein [Sphingobium subterraneum]
MIKDTLPVTHISPYGFARSNAAPRLPLAIEANKAAVATFQTLISAYLASKDWRSSPAARVVSRHS